MDRNARLLSLLISVLTVSVVGYMAWNPRGQPRSTWSGQSPPNPSDSGTGSVVDPGPALEARSLLPGVQRDSDRDSFANHIARLHAGGLELTREDLWNAGEDNLFDAVMRLRPYWLSDTLAASVRVGAQLIGEIATLRDVPLRSTDFVRLEFSPVEPHWVVRVFLIGA